MTGGSWRGAQGTGETQRLWRDERGVAVVAELIILAPIFMALVLLAVFFGRMLNARSDVDGAARDAVRAASLARSPGAAQAAATAAAWADLSGTQRTHCATWSAPAELGNFRPGGTVTVTVTCNVDLSGLGLLGLPGTKTLTAQYTAPVDTFRGT